MADGTGPLPVGIGEAPSSPADQAARLQGFVQAGGRAAILLCRSRTTRATVLDRMLAELPNHATRAGNPLASPLTLHRLLFQIGAGAGDGEEVDVLLRCLQEQAGPAGLAVLAVDDAHTLAPCALAVLAQVPSPATKRQPGRLLILAGHPNLMAESSQPGLAGLHDPARFLVLRTEGAEDGCPELAAPAGMSGSPAYALGGGDPVPTSAPPASGPAPGRVEAEPPADLPAVQVPGRPADRHHSRLPVLAGGAVGVAVLAILMLSWGGPAAGPAESVPAAPPLAPASAPAPVSLIELVPAATPEPVLMPVPAPTPEPVPALPEAPPVAGSVPAPSAADATAPEVPRFTPLPRPAAVSSDADMRRGFDTFLDRAGRDTASLSPANREALFREYLEWRGRGPAGGTGRTVP